MGERIGPKGVIGRGEGYNDMETVSLFATLADSTKYLRASSFLDTWILYECQVSPLPPFHDYQKYIPVKCTPRFSSLVS